MHRFLIRAYPRHPRAIPDMLPDLTNAIVKITSRAAGNANFGTGFVICRAADGDYVLTCKHVVNAVGPEAILVDDAPAAEVVSGDEAGRDLAVLRVAPNVLRAAPLRLSVAFPACGEFVTQGFHHDKTTVIQTDGSTKSINLTISDRLTVHIRTQADPFIAHGAERIAALRLNADDPDFPLLPGYSGAPLLDANTGAVVGVISIRREAGLKGLALAVQELRTLWPARADELFPALDLRDVIPEPIMNLERELPEFARIVAQRNQPTRLINIYGGSGRGKTLLLNFYRRIAAAHHLPCLSFELAQTNVAFEKCLEQIVAHFGPKKFKEYNTYALKGRGNMPDDEWQRNLTRQFFIDASDEDNFLTPPLLVLFDSYNADKPEETFKNWLNDWFFPYLPHCRALLVVVAGQEKIAPLSTIEACCQSVELQCLSLKHFQEYAAQWNVPLSPPMIEAVYHKEQGNPKLFVEMIRAFTPRPGGAA